MFYYLLYNSSFSFIIDNRLFLTILYGSILYIITHAILSYCKVDILEIIHNYFWFIFILDIISLVYGIYLFYLVYNNNESSSNNLDVSFNLLKNQINTISTYFNKKNNISISDNSTHSELKQPLRITTSPHTTPQISPQSHINLSNTQESNQIVKQNQTHEFSTPITTLRNLEYHSSHKNNSISHISESAIATNNDLFVNNEYGTESVSGSDIGSIMDLEDFEKNL